jgi:hypothetical protein
MTTEQQDDEALQYVPAKLQSALRHVATWQQAHREFLSVPDALWTAALCLAAVRQNDRALANPMPLPPPVITHTCLRTDNLRFLRHLNFAFGA